MWRRGKWCTKAQPGADGQTRLGEEGALSGLKAGGSPKKNQQLPCSIANAHAQGACPQQHARVVSVPAGAMKSATATEKNRGMWEGGRGGRGGRRKKRGVGRCGGEGGGASRPSLGRGGALGRPRGWGAFAEKNMEKALRKSGSTSPDAAQEVETRLYFILRSGSLDNCADNCNIDVIRAYLVCRGHHRNVDICATP